MSRIPSNPYTHPNPQSQPVYYAHPAQQAPVPMHYSQDPNMYPFDRNAASAGRPMNWTASSDGMYSTTGPTAGPSSRGDPYSAYPQPTNISQPGQQPMWSSVHPTTTTTQMPVRPDTAARSVKLEDLVAQERSRPDTGRSAASNSGLTSLPLAPTQSTENLRGNAQPEPSGGGNQAGPSEFIKKLYRMLEEESAIYGKGRPAGAARGEGAQRGSVGWGKGGTSFVVWDMNDFTTKVLPQTFRHSNFSSFVRQLNKYGFSKIKHVDGESGQIKDNVWEFQHPSFQAGGKADLDSIKRKAVVPKKQAAADEDETPPAARGLNTEDAGRLNEMERRVVNLESQLARALEEVRDAKTREMGMMNVVREMISHLATVEKESVGTPGHDADPSPRIVHLFQLFDQAASGSSRVVPNFTQLPIPYPPQPVMPFQPPVRLPPVANPMGMPATSGSNSQASPESRHGDGPSPAGSKTSQHRTSITQLVQEQPEEVIELPATNDATLYNGEPLGMTPIFADTPAWLTENMSAPMPMYHRRSSEGTALKIMMEALGDSSSQAGQQQAGVFDETSHDPLDTTQQAPNRFPPATGQNSEAAAPVASGSELSAQAPVFGELVLPDGDQSGSAPPGNAIRLRRSTTHKPQWKKQPRVLVVEDDLVYRQLSSKFLEKFGCLTETVEDAQGAIDRMKGTKYDLVLMDIFFGPNMDGRKATSLIRQTNTYTPIISMTSNVQSKDINSYYQSGMNDVLAKPFTKTTLFCILDKHLIHLKAIQLSEEVPRAIGVPPLSDQGIADALAVGAAQWQNNRMDNRNVLASMGISDDFYQTALQELIVSNGVITDGASGVSIGTSAIFGDLARKRSIEEVDDGWTPGSVADGNVPTGAVGNGMVNGLMNGGGMSMAGEGHSGKKMKQ